MLRSPAPEEDIPLDPGSLIRLARVASVDLAAGTCTLKYGDPDDPDGEVETPPIRWAAARAGLIAVWMPPSEGEQVAFACPDGDLASAVVLGSLWSDANPAPGSTTRAVVQFDDGAVLAYDPAAHHADITLPVGATLAIAADGGIEITGPIQITGDVAITGNVTVTGTLTADEDVIGGGKSLKTHKHTGVQAGAAQTGEPA